MTKHPLRKLCFIGLSFCLIGAVPLRDPTQPPMAAPIVPANNTEKSAGALQLTAVFIYPTYQLAIINGLPLKQGDHIGEYTITRIETNTVELQGPTNDKLMLTLVMDMKK